MAVYARFVSAIVVVIALIATQMVPAWAGCHSQRHAAAKVHIANDHAPGLYGTASVLPIEADAASTVADQPPSFPNDVCLGSCGCTCGLSGAFVLAIVTAIDAPHGIALTRDYASAELPLGDRPDGPRRPPRITA